MEPVIFINTVANGVLLGGFLALMAWSMSVLLGVAKVLNLAHGDFIVLAAYLYFALLPHVKNPFLALPAVTVIIVAIGFIYYRFSLHKLIPRGLNDIALFTFATSIIIQNALLVAFTADQRMIRVPELYRPVLVGNIALGLRYILNFAIALILFIVLYLFYKRTLVGKVMRGVPYDNIAAQILGIDVKKIYGYVMIIAMLITGIAGLFFGITFLFNPSAGTLYTLLSLAVVVMGGMGSLRGTFIGGIIIGIVYTIAGLFLPVALQFAVTYLVTLIMLIIRPQGLFGEKV
jgi:branched-chain amino acid transport system permease protein